MTNVFFFFSSRRRHTRLQGDWSSDVCSSDLPEREAHRRGGHRDHASRQKAEHQGVHDIVDEQQVRPGDLPQVPVQVEPRPRSEEHTSELQSPCNLVCRLLLEKKNITEKK